MEIRNLSATIDSSSLNVSAQVHVSSSAITASLERKVPQGSNPNVLLLKLKLTKEQAGGLQAFTWVDVRYNEAVAERKFKQVAIRAEGKTVATVDVIDQS